MCRVLGSRSLRRRLPIRPLHRWPTKVLSCWPCLCVIRLKVPVTCGLRLQRDGPTFGGAARDEESLARAALAPSFHRCSSITKLAQTLVLSSTKKPRPFATTPSAVGEGSSSSSAMVATASPGLPGQLPGRDTLRERTGQGIGSCNQDRTMLLVWPSTRSPAAASTRTPECLLLRLS